MVSVVLKAYIHAPIEQVWEAISDHEGYTRFKGIDLAKLIKEGGKERRSTGFRASA